MTRHYPQGPTNFNAWLGLTWRHALSLWQDPVATTQHWHERYGDVVFFRLFHREAFQVSHPALIREILVTKASSFVKHPREMDILRRYTLGSGIISAEGEPWVRQRRLLLPAFQAEFGEQLASASVAEGARTVEDWRTGEVISIHAAMTDLLVNAVSSALFGADARERALELAEAMTELSQGVVREFRSLGRWLHWLPSPARRRREAALRVLTQFIDDVIRKRRLQQRGMDEHVANDFLSVLLRAVDREGDQRGMTDAQARTEALTMLFAGQHTSAATLAWTFHLLAQNPLVRDRLEQEVDEALQGRQPDVHDLAELPYTVATIKESLRIFPSAWALFSREAVEDVTIGEYLIPRGSLVLIIPLLVQRDARWFEQPDRFQPERFLQEGEVRFVPGSYLPFGLGAHHCLGMRAAMQALPLTLATIVQRTRLYLIPGQRPVRLEPQIALRPGDDLQMRVTLRDNDRDPENEFANEEALTPTARDA